MLDKMTEKGLTEIVQADIQFNFRFPKCEQLPTPVVFAATATLFSSSHHMFQINSLIFLSNADLSYHSEFKVETEYSPIFLTHSINFEDMLLILFAI